jgi:hypothetical protein
MLKIRDKIVDFILRSLLTNKNQLHISWHNAMSMADKISMKSSQAIRKVDTHVKQKSQTDYPGLGKSS